MLGNQTKENVFLERHLAVEIFISFFDALSTTTKLPLTSVEMRVHLKSKNIRPSAQLETTDLSGEVFSFVLANQTFLN